MNSSSILVEEQQKTASKQSRIQISGYLVKLNLDFINTVLLLYLHPTMNVQNAYTQEKDFAVIEYKSFNNPDGNMAIVDPALNKGEFPVKVQIGYNIADY